jgi:hypothetical protein
LRSAFLRSLEGKPPDHGVFAEAGTNAVNRMLDLDCPVVDEIAGIGMIRRCEPTMWAMTSRASSSWRSNRGEPQLRQRVDCGAASARQSRQKQVLTGVSFERRARGAPARYLLDRSC